MLGGRSRHVRIGLLGRQVSSLAAKYCAHLRLPPGIITNNHTCISETQQVQHGEVVQIDCCVDRDRGNYQS